MSGPATPAGVGQRPVGRRRRTALGGLRLAGAVLAAQLTIAPVIAAQVPVAGPPDGPAAEPPPRVPQGIEFQVWFLALDPPVQSEQLIRSSLPAGGRLRVTFADGVPDLARAVSELLASTRQAVAAAVRGRQGGVGTLLGSLGHPVRFRMRTGPVVSPPAGVEPPDLREAALTLELMALSVAPDGRILTRITLQLGTDTGAGPRASYSHTLWLDERAGAPLAFLWRDAGPDAVGVDGQANGLAPSRRPSDGAAGPSAGDGALPVYALGVSARRVDAPGPGVGLVRVAELAPLEEPFFRILDDRQPSRPQRPPAARFEIGFDAWLSRDAPVWRMKLTQPLWEGNWVLEADAAWAEPPAEVEARAALRMRLVHDLALLVEGSSRFSDAGEALSPALGFGLAETTYPLGRLSLEARYLPVVYARSAPSSPWRRESAAWEAGATLRGSGWSLSLQAGRSALHGLGVGGTLSVAVGRGFFLHAGWRTFPESGRDFLVAGLSYRPAP